MGTPATAPNRVASPRPAAVAGVGAVLLGYQHALNQVPFPEAAYVPANLTLAGAALALAHRRWELSGDELGLDPACFRPGVAIGAAAFAAVGAGMLLAYGLPAAQPFLEDQRAAGVEGAALAYWALVRIPLGTAVPEEALFRGVLLAAFHRRLGWWAAAVASSALFGLWHIAPTIVLLERNELDLDAAAATLALGAAVAGTALAGIGFCVLRRWGRGLLAPILAHWATNALSLVAAAVAQRGTP